MMPLCNCGVHSALSSVSLNSTSILFFFMSVTLLIIFCVLKKLLQSVACNLEKCLILALDSFGFLCVPTVVRRCC